MTERSSGLGARPSRRRLLQAAATGAGLASVALTGCSSRKPSSPGSAATAARATNQPKKGGVLVHAGGSGVGSFDSAGTQIDPHINSPVGARTFRLMYEGLLGYDPHTYAVQPELAQKWEQVSPSEVVFHLQPGVKWQNKPPLSGRELTADDVVFSLKRVRSDDPKFANRSLLGNADQVQAVDKATVRVTTKGPDATILAYLSADPPLVLAPEVIQKYDKIIAAEAVVGTGPFIMRSVEERVGAEYVRNPDYWKPGLPYLDGLRTKQFNDQSEAYAAYLAGQVDFLLLPGQETKSYIAKQGAGYTPDWFKEDGVYPMLQPNTKLKPMSDERLPRALRLLADHNEFITGWVEPWFGRGRHGSSLCTALDAWDFTHDEYAKMLEWRAPKDDANKEALSLLSAAGYTPSNPLTFELSAGVDGFAVACSQLLQAQWAKNSGNVVRATIKSYDSPGQNTIRANRTFTVFVGGNNAAFPEPDAYFSALFQTGSSRNYAGFSDPSFDAMIQKQRTITDLPQRKALVKQMVQYLIDHGPTTILVNRYFLNGATPRVHGYAAEFLMNGRQFQSVWVDT